MSSDVLLDTDVMIDHLRGARKLRFGVATFWYSSITRAELLAGRRGEAEAQELMSEMHELVVGRETADLGGRIKRVFGLDIPDALIAATALAHDLDLVSRNRRHFERVPGLRLREAL